MQEPNEFGPSIENSLIQFANTLWQRRHVKDALMQWQTAFDADINLLITLCWLGQHGASIEDLLLWPELVAISDRWQACLQPLRASREQMKTMDEHLYQDYLQLELKTEYKELDELFRFSQNLSSGSQTGFSDAVPSSTESVPVHELLTHYLRHLQGDRTDHDSTAINDLVQALSR
ncbi:Uncharacterised protein [BD1-7 clade bacterium]|uniref:TIGR02444 family protein n=1 Tax=BD1-7 clade bacterium TaxID=2029982 RepID=A0A5S9QGT5_9GAMM|nr:Uncharacterised protein [BD1-7 clade bacterium]